MKRFQDSFSALRIAAQRKGEEPLTSESEAYLAKDENPSSLISSRYFSVTQGEGLKQMDRENGFSLHEFPLPLPLVHGRTRTFSRSRVNVFIMWAERTAVMSIN